jgi:hypothetical protein
MQNWVKHDHKFRPSNFVSIHPNLSNQVFCLNDSGTAEVNWGTGFELQK